MKKNKKQKQKIERDDRIEFEGIVVEACPGAMFKVDMGSTIIPATLSGKMRQNRIRILPGDRVKVEVSPYDLSRGRISYRLKH